MTKLRPIHIINPFSELGGSEFRALALYDALKSHANVSLWSEYPIHQELRQQYPIQAIAWQRNVFPKTGTFIFVGVYFRVGRWYYMTMPRRVILVNNMPATHSFAQRLRKLNLRRMRQVEVVYASAMLQRSFDYPGKVEYSWIDIDRFTPSVVRTLSTRSLIVGRHSRDVPEKHHQADPVLYRTLAAQGWGVRILGGTCLSAHLEDCPTIELLPVGAEPSELFLQGLDCFFYRTADEWLEPFGRTVVEAMACGLPVVCAKRGGYTEIIQDGENGFLFETESEAVAILQRLQEDESLRQQIGKAARRQVEALFSSKKERLFREYYLA